MRLREKERKESCGKLVEVAISAGIGIGGRHEPFEGSR